jgi:hypothetical protein
MSHPALARDLLTSFCALQGIATIALDLNRTHAAHPQWLGHARFHVVWQTVTVALLCAFAIGLIWYPGPLQAERFYAAALLASLPVFGFFAALITRRAYGGTLSDPGGIPPVVVTVMGQSRHIDLNLVAEIAGLSAVILAITLYRA